MAYIYQADVWCDDCGKAICEQLQKAGLAPANPADEHTFDSDEYPKRAGDDDESDSPQHCAAGEDCLNAIVLPGGNVGFLFGELTAVGVEYVKEAIAEGGEVADLWKEHYADYL
jgi:hypothetical protein